MFLRVVVKVGRRIFAHPCTYAILYGKTTSDKQILTMWMEISQEWKTGKKMYKQATGC